MTPTDEGLEAYRPPEAQDEAPPAAATGLWIYRSVEGLGKAIVVLFAAHAALVAGMVGLGVMLQDMVSRAKAGDISVLEDLRGAVAAVGLAVVVTLAVLIALVVLLCIYLPRANRNARALGAEGMTFTPGWCAGWMFVPLFHLWRPYYVIKELWQASEPRLDVSWRTVEAPAILALWWWLSIGSAIVGLLPKDAELSVTRLVLQSLVGIIGSALAAVFFSRLTKRQAERRQAVQATGTVAPGVLGY